MSALPGADLIMNDESEDSSTPLVRVVHALPERTDPIVADSEKLTSEEEADMAKILADKSIFVRKKLDNGTQYALNKRIKILPNAIKK